MEQSGRGRRGRRAGLCKGRGGILACTWEVMGGGDLLILNGSVHPLLCCPCFRKYLPVRNSRMPKPSWRVSTWQWRRRMDEHDCPCIIGTGLWTRRHLWYGRVAAVDPAGATPCRCCSTVADCQCSSTAAPGGSDATWGRWLSLSLRALYRAGCGFVDSSRDSPRTPFDWVRSIDRSLLFRRAAQTVRSFADECRLEPELQGRAVQYLPGSGLPGQLRGTNWLCCHRTCDGSPIAFNPAYCRDAGRIVVCGLAAARAGHLPAGSPFRDVSSSFRQRPCWR